jgi:2-polyprenyl-3-methyl-5-hydroxy-6-metoxy-1,4-benzoquinol methylase
MKNITEKPEDYYSHSREEIINFIPKNSKKILDIGCGEGIFASSIKKTLNAEVWGIEMDRNSAKKASTKLDKLLVGDISDIMKEIPDNYFDCIVFNDVLEHLYDPHNVLVNIKNKLNKNGVVVCSIPNMRFIVVLFNLIFKKRWRYTNSGVLDFTHVRFFTNQSIKEMFNSLDYKLIKIKGRYPKSSKKIKILFKGFMFFLNVISLGLLSDTKYIGFICIAKPE